MSRKPIILDDGADKLLRINNYNKRLKQIMALLTIIGVVITSLYFFSIWTKENKGIENRLETFTELRHATLSRYVNSLSAETELWAGQDSIVSEAGRYIQIWERLPPYERKALREEYYGKKPNTKPSDMYRAYINHHGKSNASRSEFMDHHSYYDVFYFNLKGDLVYTVGKESDYGLNFDTGGKYGSTGLGQVFRAARDANNGASMFFDFAPYAPSNGAPASFLAAPIFDKNHEKIGVYAIQISNEKFDRVLNYSSGLGETGETYLVGEDLFMRNNSRLLKKPSLLVNKVDTPAVRAALAGKSVVMRGQNYVGVKTLIVARPLEFKNTKWAVLTEMELSELRKPFRPYFWFYLIAIAFILAFGLVQYWLLKQRSS